jgi:aminoglycoside/choline kinase family phosphotransferase
MSHADLRLQLIENWLRNELHWPLARLTSASADASFRRYFRAFRPDASSLVVMDAPPDKEDIAPYLKVTRLLSACGVHVPTIEAVDETRGLILLEDLGSTPLLTQLNAGSGAGADPDLLYGPALAALADIQQHGLSGARELAPYDRAVLLREMALLPEWFNTRHLQLPHSAATDTMLAHTFELLVHEALVQPQVLVHRDYHSRNLMVTADRNPGIIDFQDALHGPIAYDLVSLLKDCYISWPRARVEQWVAGYRRELQRRGVDAGSSDAQFLRWFDMVGLQRHIKVLGIFARLWYRDGKSGYLADLPRTLEYVRDASTRYPELAPFAQWVQQALVPALPVANTRAAQVADGHRHATA